MKLPTKGIDESLHGLGGIEEFPSKNRVFSKREKLKNVNPKELVNPSDLALIKAVWIHHKELGKPPKSRAPKLVKPKTKVITREENDPLNLTQDRNPGGHKENRASFPNQIQHKVSIIHGSNPTLEKRGRKNRGRIRQCTGGAVSRKEKHMQCCFPPLPFNLLTSLAKD